MGGHIHRVGSGPTVSQKSSASEAIAALEKRDVWSQVEKSVRNALERQVASNSNSGMYIFFSCSQLFCRKIECFKSIGVPKSVKIVADADCQLPNVHNVLIADNRELLAAICKHLGALNIQSAIVNAELTGDASEVGEQLAQPLRAWLVDELAAPPFASSSAVSEEAKSLARSGSRIFAWIYGGETTVRFPDTPPLAADAKGGRNQEACGCSAFLTNRRQIADGAGCSQLVTRHTAASRLQPLVYFRLHRLRRSRRAYRRGWRPRDCRRRSRHVAYSCQYRQISTTQNIVSLRLSRCGLGKSDNFSYEFWSNYKNGAQHIKFGKSGNNLMDVQMLLFVDKS